MRQEEITTSAAKVAYHSFQEFDVCEIVIVGRLIEHGELLSPVSNDLSTISAAEGCLFGASLHRVTERPRDVAAPAIHARVCANNSSESFGSSLKRAMI